MQYINKEEFTLTKHQETILLIDGDVLAYRAAAVAEKREVQVITKSSGIVELFKNRTEFKDLLKSKDIIFCEEDYEIIDKVEALSVSIATGIIKRQIQELKDKFFADSVQVFVSGKDNFRDSLPLPKKYKGNRAGMLRPVHLRDAKLYMVQHHGAKICNGCEADDLVIIHGYQELTKGNIPIVITVDKDANAYSGLSVYDFTQENPEIILLPDFGSLWDTGKKITGNGFIFLCYQWVYGDPVDDYKPSYLTKDKFGEKAAFKLLKDCTTAQEALEKVVSKYKEWYPKEFEYQAWDDVLITADYKFMLDLYYKCAKMKKTEDDALDAKEFLKEHGIDLDA